MKGIIGTAGHIDHGKTELIRALTGQNTDRLKEEQERGISIDIGFAYLDLPDGDRVGIVDVPGHERFIKNMLAGATGINLVLFVVAADDGPMPQTLEHLEILDLLNVQAGIGVITKKDLVDEARIEGVKEEVRLILDQTTLAGSGIVAVSAKTGEGIEELKQKIVGDLKRIVLPSGKRFFRLPVDRSFTMKGHGTVVTGTVLSGSVAVEDEPMLVPAGTPAKIRKIQVHGRSVERAETGQRAALNLSRIEKGEIARGNSLCSKEIAYPTRLIGARIRPIRLSPGELKNRGTYHFHAGTTEILASLTHLPDPDGEKEKERFAQIEFPEPVHLLLGDRFILRSADAKKTLGGGTVLLPWMPKLNRKNRLPWMERLRAVLLPSLSEQMAGTVALEPSGMEIREICRLFNVLPEEAETLLAPISSLRRVAQENRVIYVPGETVKKLRETMIRLVEETHKREPNKLGVERTVLLEWAGKGIRPPIPEWVADDLLRSGSYVQTKGFVQRAGFQISFSEGDEGPKNRILDIYLKAGFSPPRVEEVAARIQANISYTRKIVSSLREMGDLIPVAGDTYYHRKSVSEAEGKLRDALAKKGSIRAGEYRDIMGFGRKLAIEFLEHFDRTGVTRREGDVRKLAK